MKYEELIIHTDGGARGNPGPAAIGVSATTASGETLFEISEYIGHQTNNVAEYTAVIHALKHLQEHDLQSGKITFVLDSELIVRQIFGTYKVKEPKLQVLVQNVRNLINELKQQDLIKQVNFHHVLRAQNKHADQLVNQALDMNKFGQ